MRKGAEEFNYLSSSLILSRYYVIANYLYRSELYHVKNLKTIVSLNLAVYQVKNLKTIVSLHLALIKALAQQACRRDGLFKAEFANSEGKTSSYFS
jgi:hypothetical protein